jgi:hypothetical protein
VLAFLDHTGLGPKGFPETKAESREEQQREGRVYPNFSSDPAVDPQRNSIYLIMTKIQLQSEIQKVLDNVPESVLLDVLDFLKALQDQPLERVSLANNLRQILSEDKELLEKLAQ